MNSKRRGLHLTFTEGYYRDFLLCKNIKLEKIKLKNFEKDDLRFHPRMKKIPLHEKLKIIDNKNRLMIKKQ